MFEELLPTTSFRKLIQILNWCYAASHQWTVGRALKGCKTEAQRKACIQWVTPLLDDIFDGKTANVIQRLEKRKPSSENAQDAVRKCIKYFKEHQKRMRYALFRKQNLLIGSGAIESVHAWVIQARCRLPGMRWSQHGANAMLRPIKENLDEPIGKCLDCPKGFPLLEFACSPLCHPYPLTL